MKKRRPDTDYLLDMKTAVELVLQFTQGMDQNAFESNLMCQSAVTYQLAVLGEAAKQVSSELRAKHPSMPWKSVAGMRDILIHAYHGLDLSVIWKIIKDDLPPLQTQLLRLCVGECPEV